MILLFFSFSFVFLEMVFITFYFFNITEAIKTNMQSYGLLEHYTPISTFMGVLVRTMYYIMISLCPLLT